MPLKRSGARQKSVMGGHAASSAQRWRVTSQSSCHTSGAEGLLLSRLHWWDALVSQLQQVTVVFEGVTPAFIGHLDGNEQLVKPAMTVSGRAGWPDRTPRPYSMHVYMVS